MRTYTAVEVLPCKYNVEVYDDETDYANLTEAEYLTKDELFQWLSTKMIQGDTFHWDEKMFGEDK